MQHACIQAAPSPLLRRLAVAVVVVVGVPTQWRVEVAVAAVAVAVVVVVALLRALMVAAVALGPRMSLLRAALSARSPSPGCPGFTLLSLRA